MWRKSGTKLQERYPASYAGDFLGRLGEFVFMAKSNLNLTIWLVQMHSKLASLVRNDLNLSNSQIRVGFCHKNKFPLIYSTGWNKWVKSCFLLVRSCMNYEAIAPKSWTMWRKVEQFPLTKCSIENEKKIFFENNPWIVKCQHIF